MVVDKILIYDLVQPIICKLGLFEIWITYFYVVWNWKKIGDSPLVTQKLESFIIFIVIQNCERMVTSVVSRCGSPRP